MLNVLFSFYICENFSDGYFSALFTFQISFNFSQRWQEVEDLHVKKETITKTTGEDDNKDNESDDLEEEDLEQFLDWRSKKSWK